MRGTTDALVFDNGGHLFANGSVQTYGNGPNLRADCFSRETDREEHVESTDRRAHGSERVHP